MPQPSTARPKAAETVLKQFQSIVVNGNGQAMESVISPLTFREIQVLNYIADGNGLIHEEAPKQASLPRSSKKSTP